MAKQNKPKKNSIFFKFIFFLLFISLLVFLGILKYLNVLPNKYYLLLISVLIICRTCWRQAKRRRRKRKKGRNKKRNKSIFYILINYLNC